MKTKSQFSRKYHIYQRCLILFSGDAFTKFKSSTQVMNSNQVFMFEKNYWYHSNGSVQDCSISIVNALGILQSCTKL